MKKTVLLLIALCLVCTPLIFSKEKGRSFEKIKFPLLFREDQHLEQQQQRTPHGASQLRGSPGLLEQDFRHS